MSSADAAPMRYCFAILAEPDPNALARLFEPFVIHNVLPERFSADVGPTGADYLVRIEFLAGADLARRLFDRIAAIVAVRRIECADRGCAIAA